MSLLILMNYKAGLRRNSSGRIQNRAVAIPKPDNFKKFNMSNFLSVSIVPGWHFISWY